MDNQAHMLFARSYQLKDKLKRILTALDSMEGRSGLCIGPVPPALRARLLATGGDWSFDDSGDAHLPFADGSFDRVILLDQIDALSDDYAFLADVHRVLKTAGILFVDVENRKRWTVWRPLRRLFGVGERADQRVRPGYTERELFDLLKDGFDLQEARTYSRFFVEGVETLQRLALGTFVGTTAAEADQEEDDLIARRIARIQTVTYPFFLLAAKLDWFIFYTHGYRLYVIARRRLWKPRRAPKLRDGRTLADATLNTKIGTAAPF